MLLLKVWVRYWWVGSVGYWCRAWCWLVLGVFGVLVRYWLVLIGIGRQLVLASDWGYWWAL